MGLHDAPAAAAQYEHRGAGADSRTPNTHWENIMIHYHGASMNTKAAIALLTGRHACVSFASPGPVELAAEVCQSFILDNGAFSFWRAGKGEVNVNAYAEWIAHWQYHPGFDWCLIPDVIDGGIDANIRMEANFYEAAQRYGVKWSRCVPVFHLDEPLDRLTALMVGHDRVALGSAGAYAEVGTPSWWDRMSEVMAVACDAHGRPKVRFHGLRMLNPTVFSQLPLASADSTNVARNIGMDNRWKGTYTPRSKSIRALVLADRIEHHASATRWNGESRGVQMNMELLG